MSRDPITDEIRSIRHQLAVQFENDLSRILADVRRREASDGRTYVTLPSRPVPATIAGQSDAAEPIAAKTNSSPLAQ